jgi:hypothetical protein
VPVPMREETPWPQLGGDDRPLEELREACGDRHEVWPREVAVDEYATSGLSTTHMGRPITEDRLFFAAALAAGDALAEATVSEFAA